MSGYRRISSYVAADRRGSAAIEFALLCPFLFLLIIGFAQVGILFIANAGLRHAVGEGSRYATIYPSPTDAQVIELMRSKRFGLNPAYIVEETVVRGKDTGVSYAELTASYAVPLNFFFFKGPSVKLRVSRRAYFP